MYKKLRKILILSGLIFYFINNPFVKALEKEDSNIKETSIELNSNQCNIYKNVGLYKLQELALNKNRNFLNTKLKIKSAKDMKKFYKKSLLPYLSITGTIDKAIDQWTDVTTKNKTDSSSTNAFVLSSNNTNTLSAEINWDILNPTLYSSIKSAHHDLKDTEYLSQISYNNLLKNVRLSAINVDQEIDNIKSTEYSIKRAQKILEIAKAQLKAGFITEQDFLRQKNQSFAYQNELSVNLLKLNSSLINLNLLINNLHDNCPLIAHDSINYLKNKRNKISNDDSDLIPIAFEKRLDLKSIKEKINSKKANLQYYRRANLPATSLYLSSTIYETNEDEKLSFTDKDKTDTYYNDISIGLTSTTTFSGGQNKSMINSLKSEIKILENEYLDLKDSIKSNINNLLIERDTYNQKDIVLKKQFNLAKKTYSAIELSFSKGYSTMTEVLDAQRSLSSVEKDLIINESSKAKNLVNFLRELSINEL